jgi:hypothetical protein
MIQAGMTMPTDEELRQMARKTAEEKSGSYTHLAIYIAVNLFLIAIWWATGGPGTFPWFIFILFGWGIGLAAHFISVFRGKAYVERMAEREYQRLKREERGRWEKVRPSQALSNNRHPSFLNPWRYMPPALRLTATHRSLSGYFPTRGMPQSGHFWLVQGTPGDFATSLPHCGQTQAVGGLPRLCLPMPPYPFGIGPPHGRMSVFSDSIYAEVQIAGLQPAAASVLHFNGSNGNNRHDPAREIFPAEGGSYEWMQSPFYHRACAFQPSSGRSQPILSSFKGLQKREIWMNMAGMRYMPWKYVDRYKQVTMQETGKPGPLYYHSFVTGAATVLLILQ